MSLFPKITAVASDVNLKKLFKLDEFGEALDELNRSVSMGGTPPINRDDAIRRWRRNAALNIDDEAVVITYPTGDEEVTLGFIVHPATRAAWYSFPGDEQPAHCEPADIIWPLKPSQGLREEVEALDSGGTFTEEAVEKAADEGRV